MGSRYLKIALIEREVGGAGRQKVVHLKRHVVVIRVRGIEFGTSVKEGGRLCQCSSANDHDSIVTLRIASGYYQAIHTNLQTL